MTNFERSLNIIFSRLFCYENDPGFVYRMFKLPNEDQARIFRMSRKEVIGSTNNDVPVKGMFVSAAMHPKLNQLCLAFSSFPKDGGESVVHGMLAYDTRELEKGTRHIVEYFAKGTVPVADNEYAAEEVD